MHLKLVQKEQFKKQLKQLVIQLAINSLIKFKKSQKKQNNNSETITNELDKKYLKRDMYLQKKDRKALMISNLYITIVWNIKK